MAQARKFNIIDYTTDRLVFQTYAATERAALDEYAAFRSGYATFTEMACSAVFATMANVFARAA